MKTLMEETQPVIMAKKENGCGAISYLTETYGIMGQSAIKKLIGIFGNFALSSFHCKTQKCNDLFEKAPIFKETADWDIDGSIAADG